MITIQRLHLIRLIRSLQQLCVITQQIYTGHINMARLTIDSKISGWFEKEDVLSMNIELRDTDILYHGTSAKNIDNISKEGICKISKILQCRNHHQKVHDISCEENIYVTPDKKEALRWARDAARKTDSRFSAIYKITGKDIKESGCIAYPDWNMGFTGKLDNMVLTKCDCIHPSKIKLEDDKVW